MRYSTLFGSTRRDVPADIESVNGRLLSRGGFVDFTGAGITTWLPLGLRVLRRIQAIIREEMDAVGCQELLMPALHPKEYWVKTGRWATVDVLYRVTSRTGKEYALGASHEEIVTPLAQKFIRSYRDLPLAVYQTQTKFRDELRAKGGVLRGREFGMKDAYSFHATREDFAQFYARMLGTYRRVFERCGVASFQIRASGGMFTENISDEFHVETPSGEDTLFVCRACRTGVNAEVAAVHRACATCDGPLAETKGIEIGNTFDLGTKYADACGLTFVDAEGIAHPVLMGCYGIGVTRVVGAVVETHYDERGIRWPASVAPYAIHVVAIPAKANEATAQVTAVAEALVRTLEGAGLDVLVDDRAEVSAGEKFADADLIGIPWRAVVSERSLAAGGVELKARTAADAEVIPAAEVLPAIGGARSMRTT